MNAVNIYMILTNTVRKFLSPHTVFKIIEYVIKRKNPTIKVRFFLDILLIY
jgi:hypothetical protein